jgi:hypothetical protein
MVVRVATVAFEGIEARPVDVQVQIANGNVVFTVVSLGDKAVAESCERVRAALNASGLAMPAKRITVNLAPADLPKEGSSRRRYVIDYHDASFLPSSSFPDLSPSDGSSSMPAR